MQIKRITALIVLVICICMLGGCFQKGYDTAEEDKNVELALELAKKAIKENHPSAVLSESNFRAVDVKPPNSPVLHLSDWVTGEYKDSGKWDILINVKTKEVYTSREWNKVNHYGKQLAYKLYGLDEGDMQVEVYGTLEKPYVADKPEYGSISITDMLPAEAAVTDAYVKDLLARGEYHLTYRLIVNDRVDMNLFKQTDFSSLGKNVRISVEQYPKADVDRMYTPGKNNKLETKQPLATYDSNAG